MKLRRQSTQFPSLRKSLLAVANYALLGAVNAIRKAVGQGEKGDVKEVEAFNILLDLMQCLAPPEEEPDVWRIVLREIGKIKDITPLKSWDSYARLLKLSALALFPPQTDGKSSLQSNTDNELIKPFLALLSWPEFGAFLGSQMPLDWIEIVINRLGSTETPIAKEIVHELEQRYASVIEALFKQLSQEPQHWPTARAFFELLAARGYDKKLNFCFLLLKSPLGKSEQNSARLISDGPL